MRDLYALTIFGSLISSSALGKAAATLNSSSAEATLIRRHLGRMFEMNDTNAQERGELHLLEIPNFSKAPSGTIPVPPFSLSQGALPAGQGKAYIQNIHNRLNIIICRISPIQAHLIRQDGLDDALLPPLDPPHLLSPLVHLLRLQFQLGLRESVSSCVRR